MSEKRSAKPVGYCIVGNRVKPVYHHIGKGNNRYYEHGGKVPKGKKCHRLKRSAEKERNAKVRQQRRGSAKSKSKSKPRRKSRRKSRKKPRKKKKSSNGRKKKKRVVKLYVAPYSINYYRRLGEPITVIRAGGRSSPYYARSSSNASGRRSSSSSKRDCYGLSEGACHSAPGCQYRGGRCLPLSSFGNSPMRDNYRYMQYATNVGTPTLKQLERMQTNRFNEKNGSLRGMGY
jgi:hypothetical protein